MTSVVVSFLSGFLILGVFELPLISYCQVDNEGVSLLVTESNRLLHFTVDDTGVEEKVLYEAPSRIRCVAFDPVEEVVYFIFRYGVHIWKTDIDGKNTEEVLDGIYHDNMGLCGLVFDKTSRILFYNGPEYTQISVLDLVNHTTKLIVDSALGNVMDIQLDKVNRKIYWGTYGIIATADYDGANIKQIISDGSNWIYGLHLDTDNGILYWCDHIRIQSVSVDGTQRKDVVNTRCLDIFMVDQTLYFTTYGGPIYHMPANGGNITALTNSSYSYWARLHVISTDINECVERTDNCTVNSICINTYSSFRCECLPGYSEQGLACTDIDECADNAHNCHVHAVCNNTEGSFTCSCTGYYIGDGVDCIVPFYDERPEVRIDVAHVGDVKSELIFYCDFSEHPEDVMYRTNWSVDGKLIVRTDPDRWSEGKVIVNQALTEQHLRQSGFHTVGFEVNCSIEAEDEAGTYSSQESLPQFVGIKVSSRSIEVVEGGLADFSLELTAPFGCGLDIEECQLNIESFLTQNPDECGQTVLMPNYNGALVDATRWSEPVSVTLFGQITNTYGTSATTVQLQLMTSAMSNHQMWGDYNLGIVEVKVVKDTSQIQGKSCHSVNDPHMKTFDGRNYEHQFEGNFTFYMHLQLPIEVQIQTVSCSSGGSVWCNCGAAVRAGRTVFEINRCPSQSAIWEIEHTLCEDGGDVLEVKRRGSNYDVSLPTGGKVVISVYGHLLNVYMYPSVQDIEASVGLCGKMSQNGTCRDDFYMRDGSYSPDSSANADCNTAYRTWQNDLTAFSESWRVPSGSNLFDPEDHESLSNWPDGDRFCPSPSIEYRGLSESRGSDAAGCSAGNAHASCSSLPGYTHVTESACSISDRRRRRRSVKQTASSAETLRYRRQTDLWSGNWTEESARENCEKLFQDSRSVQVCGEVEGVETTDSIDNCVLDIQLTGTTDFGEYSLDTVRSNCLHQVVVNPVLQDNTSSQTNRSVYDVVLAEACPGDCSGNGNCTGGSCLCNTNYGGEDCSVDLSAPPTISDIHDNGYCDTSRDTCHMISVYGETFTDGNTSCHVEHFKVRNTGLEYELSEKTDAKVQSISHVQCRITPAQVDDDSSNTDYVRVYRVSVSNDGVHYSNNISVLVYDSTCVTGFINETDVQWKKQDSYCLYKETCFTNGSIRSDDECKVCNANGTMTSWRNSTDTNCTASTTTHLISTPHSSTTGDSSSTIRTTTDPGNTNNSVTNDKLDSAIVSVLAVAGGVVGFAVLVTVVVLITLKIRQKSHFEKEDDFPRFVEATDCNPRSSLNYKIIPRPYVSGQLGNKC